MKLYFPQNVNSFNNEFDLMGIPTVQLQLEQLPISLFRNTATLLEHIPIIIFKHKKSKNATILAIFTPSLRLEKNYSKQPLGESPPTY